MTPDQLTALRERLAEFNLTTAEQVLEAMIGLFGRNEVA